MRCSGAILVLLLALSGCTERTGTSSPQTSSPVDASGPIELQEPVELARVLPASGVTVLPGPDGERLPLEEPFLTITELAGATTEFQEYTNSWVVVLSLTDGDARVFGDWTGAHVGERVAMVTGGRVISAPEVQSAIPGGEIVVSARYSEHEATDLLAQITGR
ncbi:MAG: SecDF P1 head subdomain-containing protein [Actinophytocola sp.]|uniref:SecDF P1 head subdomain-containing protein n=1 Tax=Actinophytocola sp. TaxID=1872138 RepID=UPI003D6AAACC